ncbi:MAG: hypothetical protein ABSG30_15355 [Steroidobacteraceae bacterium]|jgi:hypothetical protein
MKFRQIMSAVGLLFAAWMVPGKAAYADMVVFDSMSLFQGQQAFTKTFSVATPGTLNVTVSDIPWLDSVANLSFFLSSPTGTVGPTQNGGGSELISLAPGTYTASWFGNAQGPYDLGVVGVNIDFHPNGTPVGIPASVLLMLSGLGLLFAWPRIAPALPSSSTRVG